MVLTNEHKKWLYYYKNNIKHFFGGVISLGGAFDWANTPQGYDYWSNLSRFMKRPEQEKAVVDYLIAAGTIDLVPAKYHPKVDEDLLWD